ncbi:MAG: hypothetical protein M3Q07_28875 [Pseudobdellovibrionaceae bacterium]|nr:hypothetical protein [Pseudobdellovibrionaceae bacterium]
MLTGRARRFERAIPLAGLLLSIAYAPQGYAQTWKRLYEEEGIVAYRAEGSSRYSRYKADGVIEGNLYEVLAVMNDIPRRLEWVDNLKTIRLVAEEKEKLLRVHSVLDLPWPLTDRESLVDVAVSIDYGTQVVQLEFAAVTDPAVPIQKGLVRVPHTQGLTRLSYIDEQRIGVAYEIEFDAGGDVPAWAVKMFTEDVPAKTIKALKAQVRKTKGLYTDFVTRHKELAALARPGLAP